MTDNPYSAPGVPPPAPVRTVAEQRIRFVSFMFRLIGWVFFIFSLPFTAMLGYMLIYETWKWLGGGSFMPQQPSGKEYVPAVAAISCLTFSMLNVYYICVGHTILSGRPRGYRAAMLLSCLLFVLFFPLAILCIYYLRKHWPSYCEERAALVQEVGPI